MLCAPDINYTNKQIHLKPYGITNIQWTHKLPNLFFFNCSSYTLTVGIVTCRERCVLLLYIMCCKIDDFNLNDTTQKQCQNHYRTVLSYKNATPWLPAFGTYYFSRFTVVYLLIDYFRKTICQKMILYGT